MAFPKRIGVLLCGSGTRDGSEIHEATLTLLAIDRAGGEAVCFAPSGPQRFVRNHLTGAEERESRDMLVESARIARGKVRDVKEAKAANLDALIIPGGEGTALNLSNFLLAGTGCQVCADVARLVKEMVGAKKPVGAVCLAPATLARALQDMGVKATITIGTDAEVAGKIEAMGHRHERCAPTGCVVDREHRIVTTPAYMTAQSIGEVWQGVEKLVAAVFEMMPGADRQST